MKRENPKSACRATRQREHVAALIVRLSTPPRISVIADDLAAEQFARRIADRIQAAITEELAEPGCAA